MNTLVKKQQRNFLLLNVLVVTTAFYSCKQIGQLYTGPVKSRHYDTMCFKIYSDFFYCKSPTSYPQNLRPVSSSRAVHSAFVPHSPSRERLEPADVPSRTRRSTCWTHPPFASNCWIPVVSSSAFSISTLPLFDCLVVHTTLQL